MNICLGRTKFHQTNNCTARSDRTSQENCVDVQGRRGIYSARTLSSQLVPEDIDIPVPCRKRAQLISPLQPCILANQKYFIDERMVTHTFIIADITD